MIPDKIYLDIIEDDDIHMIAPSYENNGGVEYIRKDALVEFANKKLQESADRLDYRTNRAYAELIDHINKHFD